MSLISCTIYQYTQHLERRMRYCSICSKNFAVTRILALTNASRSFNGVDGSRFKKNDPHICVQYLERTPPESPHIFTLSETEMYVHPRSVFTADLSPHERRGNKTIVLTDDDINDIHKRLTLFLYDE